jgi:hypothetical protein
MTRSPDEEVVLPHGKGFAVSKQSLRSFQRMDSEFIGFQRYFIGNWR